MLASRSSRDRDEVETRAVILADPTLTEQQKQVLLQIYESFRKENGFEIADGGEGGGLSGGPSVADVGDGGDGGDSAAPHETAG